jgi:hypothetical protein
MDWKVLAALSVLGLALVAGLVICIATSVNSYAKRLSADPEKRRRGFEVKPIAGDARQASPALREKDDHHG